MVMILLLLLLWLLLLWLIDVLLTRVMIRMRLVVWRSRSREGLPRRTRTTATGVGKVGGKVVCTLLVVRLSRIHNGRLLLGLLR